MNYDEAVEELIKKVFVKPEFVSAEDHEAIVMESMAKNNINRDKLKDILKNFVNETGMSIEESVGFLYSTVLSMAEKEANTVYLHMN